MMHDNWLVAIAMTVSALGIAVLLYALIIMDVQLSSIDAAKQADDGTMVRVQGEIKAVKQRGNMTIITITQPTTIDIVLQQKINLSKGECAVIQGKKSAYNDLPQIGATRISRCAR